MSQKWALSLPRASAAALAPLRLASTLAVCEEPERLWLRGNTLDEPLDRLLRLIPGGQRFTVLEDGQLVPEGKRVPLGRLPEGPWMLLVDWLHVELPALTASSLAAVPVPVALVRTTEIREPALLETALALWANYVAAAPQWRIDHWSFVATRDGQVLVRGTPLPPLPGTQWVLTGQIARPAGYTWSPPVDAATLARAFALPAGDVALLREDGSWDVIVSDQWVRASRSAARSTLQALAP